MPNLTDTLNPAEREIVRYLLNDITSAERDRIGENSVVDLEYGELVKQTELALIQGYARDLLSPNERALFESKFLVTRERKRKLAAIKMQVAEQTPVSKARGAASSFVEAIADDTEREVAQYWLGELPDDEDERILERALEDSEFAEFKEHVAMDLMEAYLEDRLTLDERSKFETQFLITKERREQLLVLSALLSVRRRMREKGATEIEQL